MVYKLINRLAQIISHIRKKIFLLLMHSFLRVQKSSLEKEFAVSLKLCYLKHPLFFQALYHTKFYIKLIFTFYFILINYIFLCDFFTQHFHELLKYFVIIVRFELFYFRDKMLCFCLQTLQFYVFLCLLRCLIDDCIYFL